MWRSCGNMNSGCTNLVDSWPPNIAGAPCGSGVPAARVENGAKYFPFFHGNTET
jgi:hypothetical protein